MYTITERHDYILEQLDKKGFIRVQEIAEALGVTGATIRKDLRTLESLHKLYRNHGSASPVKQKVIDLPVQEKSLIHAAQKKAIAIAAAQLVSEDDAILLTSGSTIEAFALNLKPKGKLNAVTPSLRVGVFLSEKEDINVLMLGGHIVKKSFSTRDAYTLEGLKNVRCSKLFFSCDGFSLEAGITTAFVEEANVTNSMMDAAMQVILLADSSKLGKVGFGKICDISSIDILITDSDIPDGVKQSFENAGVQVIIA